MIRCNRGLSITTFILNLVRAVLFGVKPGKTKDIITLFQSYQGGKPNSLIMGGPMGWSWYATLDATHHGSLAGPANAHRHSDLANIGIDDHHARDHATRHHSGGADALALGSIAGNLTDAQHGSRTVANAHDHSHLSGVTSDQHHARSHDHSLATDGSPIAVAGVPSLPTSKITSGRFGMARMPDGTNGYVLTAKGPGIDPVYEEAPAGMEPHAESHESGGDDEVSLAASQITSGRFGMARMPDGTNNYVLTAKGAGVDPIYQKAVYGDLPFSDLYCVVCGKHFKIGDTLTLKVVSFEQAHVQVMNAVPVHYGCVEVK